MYYINDPRENTINQENGYMLESDNRIEEMYNWSGKILDLCDLPVEEYMKPMTVIAIGGGSLPEAKYTLKFVIDGVVVGQEKIASGEPIVFNIDAIKENRNFLGWYNGASKYEEGSLMPSKNLTLTAKYECDVKFVFIVDDVEEEVSAYTIGYNSILNEIPNTEIPGFEFNGWVPSLNSPITAHTVFYGTFKSIIYSVTWDGYVDGAIKQEYKYNDTLIQPINPEKEGYTFVGWDKIIPEKVTSNLMFMAKFDVNQYVVYYHINVDGVESGAISSITLNYSSTIPQKEKPVESGYTFTEWIGYNENTNEVFTGTTMPAFNIKYVSERTTNEYIIKYFDNNDLIYEEKYLYGATIIPYVYEKIGWTVSEWSNLPKTMPYHNIEVHCVSVINKYIVTFKDQDGKKYIVEANYGTKIKDIIPKIEGKTFNVAEEILNSTVAADNMTIEGEIIINKYKVSVEGVDGIEELPYGTNVKEYFETNFPPEDGYHIIVESSHDTVPANNSLVVKVIYEANVWTLSYSTTGVDGKYINGEKELAYNTLILPELPMTDFEGYNFNGWFVGENKIDEDDTMPNNNLSAIGIYEVISFIVIVKDGDFEVLNKKYAYGTKFQKVLDDIKEYRDEKYNEGYETIVNINPEYVIKSSMEINIEKNEREFVLTFMNEENVISSAIVKFNSVISYPDMSGYTENGIEYIFAWDDLSYDGKPMPAMNVVIVGRYQEKQTAPIFYGAYVTSARTANEMVFNENDMGPYFKTAKASELLEDDGKFAPIFVPADEYLLSEEGQNLSDKEWDEYCDNRILSHCWLLPKELVKQYSFRAYVNNEGYFQDLTTYGKNLTINNTEYVLYIFLNPDLKVGDSDSEWEYNLYLKK